MYIPRTESTKTEMNPNTKLQDKTVYLQNSTAYKIWEYDRLFAKNTITKFNEHEIWNLEFFEVCIGYL